MSLREEGQEIARKLGNEVIYEGPWLPNGEKGEFYGHWFTDRVTGSSFSAKTLEEAKATLIQSRKDWGEKPPVFPNNPAGKIPEREVSPLCRQGRNFMLIKAFIAKITLSVKKLGDASPIKHLRLAEWWLAARYKNPTRHKVSPFPTLWIIPVGIILGIGAGLAILNALAREQAPEEAPEEIELAPGGNTVRWVGGTVKDFVEVE